MDAILFDLRSKYVCRPDPPSPSLPHYASVLTPVPSLFPSPRRSDDVRFRAANELYNYVRGVPAALLCPITHLFLLQILASSRSLSAEAFNKAYSEIHARCFALVNSSDLQDKLAGVTAIGACEQSCTTNDPGADAWCW